MNNQSSKVTKFSDIRVGMLVRPINGNRERGGIISRVDRSDNSYMFGGQWGWDFQLGKKWDVVDTRLELPIEANETRGVNCRNIVYSPLNDMLTSFKANDDTTKLKPYDYRSMLEIAVMMDDEAWFDDICKKINGDVAE